VSVLRRERAAKPSEGAAKPRGQVAGALTE
jgi:hypothetical protein